MRCVCVYIYRRVHGCIIIPVYSSRYVSSDVLLCESPRV